MTMPVVVTPAVVGLSVPPTLEDTPVAHVLRGEVEETVIKVNVLIIKLISKLSSQLTLVLIKHVLENEVH